MCTLMLVFWCSCVCVHMSPPFCIRNSPARRDIVPLPGAPGLWEGDGGEGGCVCCVCIAEAVLSLM